MDIVNFEEEMATQAAILLSIRHQRDRSLFPECLPKRRSKPYAYRLHRQIDTRVLWADGINSTK